MDFFLKLFFIIIASNLMLLSPHINFNDNFQFVTYKPYVKWPIWMAVHDRVPMVQT